MKVKAQKGGCPAKKRRYPSIDLCGNSQISIEGSENILEYTSAVVRISTQGMIISIFGMGLCLSYMSETVVTIKGTIAKIEFLN